MTPCGFLCVEIAEENDIFISRVEGILNIEVGLYSQTSIVIKIRVITSFQSVKLLPFCL